MNFELLDRQRWFGVELRELQQCVRGERLGTFISQLARPGYFGAGLRGPGVDVCLFIKSAVAAWVFRSGYSHLFSLSVKPNQGESRLIKPLKFESIMKRGQAESNRVKPRSSCVKTKATHSHAAHCPRFGTTESNQVKPFWQVTIIKPNGEGAVPSSEFRVVSPSDLKHREFGAVPGCGWRDILLMTFRAGLGIKAQVAFCEQ